MEQQLAWLGNGALAGAAILLMASALLGLWPLYAAGRGRRVLDSGKSNGAGPGGGAGFPSAATVPLLTAWPLWLHAAAWALVTAAMGLLIGLFLSDAFGFAYVAARSSRALNPVYKVAALWAGQEGSLVLWLWLQSGYGLIVAWRARGGRLRDRGAAGILAAVAAFFAILVAWVLDPFALRLPAPADGAGMNPILQSYWMTSHPVMLYLGYVGFSVPFAYALSSLLTGEREWIRITRRWSLVAWTFLSIGILYGARWAYEVLGWGGYWGWDPVENASFMPWLAATAFIHSGIIEEKRGMLRRWNYALVFVTYLLTIFGTFVTRSGILSSVHAFVESDVSPWFIGYMGFFSAAFLYAMIARWPELVDDRPLVSPLSKESSFLAGNVVLLATCFAIFWGTVFPLVAAAFGRQVTVGTPYFDRVTGPLFWALIVLMGVGPLIAWRKASADNLKRQFTAPLVNAFFFAVWLLVIGVRELAPLLALPAVAFVTITILMEFAKGVNSRRKSRKEPLPLALVRLMNRSPGRYGGYVVHFGVLLVVAGICLSQVYQVETTAVLQVGEQTSIGPYRLSLFSVDEAVHAGVPAVEATLLVRDRDNRPLGYLVPSKRFYPTSDPGQGPTTQAAIYGTWTGDLYAVLAGWEPFGTYVGFKLYYNPGVWLIWAGGGLLVFGALFSLWPRRRAAQISEEERALVAIAELEVDYQAGKLSDAEYQALFAEISPKARAQLEWEHQAMERILAELREQLRAGSGSSAGSRSSVLSLLLAFSLAMAAWTGASVQAQVGAAGEPAMTGIAPAGATSHDLAPDAAEAGPAVVIPRETIVLRWQDGLLWALDLVTVTNVGDAVVPHVQLPLATGAGEVLPADATLELADGFAWDRNPLAPGETRRYTLQYPVMVSRWPFPLQKEVVYPTVELLVMTVPGELVAGGLDLVQGPVELVAGQALDVWASQLIAPGTLWQTVVRPGTLAGPVAGWNPGVLDLPVLAALDRFPGDWLVQWFARRPQTAGLTVGLIALIAGAIAGYAVWWERRERAGGDRTRELAARVRDIARLDLLFEQGGIREGAYARRRKRLMRRIVRGLSERELAELELSLARRAAR